MTDVNRRIVLVQRPTGALRSTDFRLEESLIPEPGPGQVLTRTLWLSLDPYQSVRVRKKTYAEPVPIGGVIVGRTVGRVVTSNDPRFAPGDIVSTGGAIEGWQDYVVSKPERKIDPSLGPVQASLSILGMPGKTAYLGVVDIGKIKAGETLVVSSAAGAVGSYAGQIAKIFGARAVGIAGGAAKCRHVVEELGFDACVDYRSPTFAEDLARACPNGIDVNFENVGGDVLAAVWPLLNDFARVPVCGLIAEYDDEAFRPGPSIRPALNKRLLVQGYIVSDPAYAHRTDDILREMSGWLREGRIKYHEEVVEGLEGAPQGLIELLAGKNVGKTVVRVSS